jgi:hypothetical protein
VLGVDHAAISALALASWNLPQPIQIAVKHHHAPEDDHSVVAHGCTKLSAVVNAADRYVNHLGHAIQPATAFDEPSPEPFLALAGDAAPQMLRDFEVEFDAMQRFF